MLRLKTKAMLDHRNQNQNNKEAFEAKSKVC